MVTNFLDRGFCFIIFVPLRRGHLYNVSSTAKDPLSPPVSSLPLLLLYFAVVQFLSLSLSIIIIFFFLLLLVEQRNFFSDVTKDNERYPHSRIWFFGFSEDDCGQHYGNKRMPWERMPLVRVWIEMPSCLEEFCLFRMAGRLRSNPARFFGFSSECGRVRDDGIGRLVSRSRDFLFPGDWRRRLLSVTFPCFARFSLERHAKTFYRGPEFLSILLQCYDDVSLFRWWQENTSLIVVFLWTHCSQKSHVFLRDKVVPILRLRSFHGIAGWTRTIVLLSRKDET